MSPGVMALLADTQCNSGSYKDFNLVKEPHKRITYKRGPQEENNTHFFEGVNWVLTRSATPPHIPNPVEFS